MSNKPLVLSFSSIKDWKDCRQRWFYKRVKKIRKRVTALPLKRGTIIHRLIELYLVGEDWESELVTVKKEYDQLMDEEKEYYGDLPTECERLIRGYIKKWGSQEIETLAVELAFGIEGDEESAPPLEIAPGILVGGKIDWVLKDYRGVWVSDHKSVGKKIPNDNFRLQDLQTVIYAKALPMLGYPEPTGVMFDYIKTKPPSKPRLLKNGTLSKAKKVTTDYDTFMEAIKENGLNPGDYREQLEKAKMVRFYDRKWIPKPKSLMDQLLNELTIIYLEIPKLKDYPYRNLRRECEMCEYFPLCSAELLGLDTDFLLKTEFIIKDREEEEEENEESEEKEDDEQ